MDVTPDKPAEAPHSERLPLAGFAILLLAHDNPDKLVRLAHWLHAAGARAFLNIDRRAPQLRLELQRRHLPPGFVILPEHECHRVTWGGFGMVAGTLALMRAALADSATRHLCLLSGAHLPVLSAAATAAFLADGLQHIELRFAAQQPEYRESLRRFWYVGIAGREQNNALLRWVNRQAWRLGKRNLAAALRGMTPVVGSQWWHMTAACARHVLNFVDRNPWYPRFFRHSRIPDESFFHTIVAASGFVGGIGTPTTWQRMQDFSPALLGEDDIPVARASGRPFARKFDLRETPSVVDQLLPQDAARPFPLVDGLRPVGAPPAPEPGEIIAILVTRNEALRLPSCLRHLRRLGVDRIIVIDNASDDDTRRILAGEEKLHVIDAPGSYAGSDFGILWVNSVLDRYAQGHWVLVVDADEALVFPGYEEVGLHALCAHLADIGSEALPTILLDCFPQEPLDKLRFSSGDDLTTAAPWFEAPRLRFESAEAFPYRQAFGGLRERLFFPEANPDRLLRRLHQRAFNLGWRVKALQQASWYRRLAPGRSPNLVKVPLLRWREGARLLASTHLLAPMRLVEAQPSGVLLHYKFLQDFHARAQDAVARGAHYDGSREYRRYLAALERHPGFALFSPDSQRYSGADQLVTLRLMQDSPAWAEARAALGLARAPFPPDPPQGIAQVQAETGAVGQG